jgi:YtcA family
MYMSPLEMHSESTERNRPRKASRRCLAGLLTGTLLLSVGCSHAPEYSIFGSFFPVWIFCSLGGLLLMTGARALIVHTAIAEHLAAPVLFYISMAIFLSCLLWLLFYS